MQAAATKSLVIWPRAYWPEGCFFGHWRSDMASPLVTGGATRRAVRKHRAPKGALRLTYSRVRASKFLSCQKAPSAKRCIKTDLLSSRHCLIPQKAPSAKRCIKTNHWGCVFCS